MRYINFRDLRAKLGDRGRSTIYRDMDLDRLPRAIKIGSRLYWNEDEVDAKLAELAG